MSDLSLHAPIVSYPWAEELANTLTHGVGALASVFAAVLLVKAAIPMGGLAVAAYSAFGAALILLFSASALYHGSSAWPELREKLRYLDHSSIYVLIAGTYTAYCLTVLRGPLGWTIFAAVWILALGGIALKLFFLGRFRILSTVGYVVMGWIIMLAFGTLKARLAPEALWLLVGGGVAYTVGSVFYAAKRMPWSHPIFHVFVLAGAACHVLSVLQIR